MAHSYLAIAFTGLAAMLLLAATPRSESDKRILQEIEAMSEPERARLMKNYERFKKLPTDQQTKYRELAAEIAASNQLSETMDKYFNWADNLFSDPYARASLAQLSESGKRVVRVNQLINEQQRDMISGHDMQVRQLQYLLHFDKPQIDRYFPFTHDIPLISEGDFDKLLDLISTASNIPDAERREMSKLPTARRAVEVLKASQAALKAANASGESLDTVWPNDQLMQKIVEQVNGLAPRWNRGWDDRFRGGGGGAGARNDMMKTFLQRRVQMFVIKNLLAYETIRLLKSNTATTPELEAFAAKQTEEELKRPERDETPEQYRAEVIFMYLIKNTPDQAKTIFDEPDMALILADWKRSFDRVGDEFFRGGRGGGGDGRGGDDRGGFRPGGNNGGPNNGPGAGRRGEGPNGERRPNGNPPPEPPL